MIYSMTKTYVPIRTYKIASYLNKCLGYTGWITEIY